MVKSHNDIEKCILIAGDSIGKLTTLINCLKNEYAPYTARRTTKTEAIDEERCLDDHQTIINLVNIIDFINIIGDYATHTNQVISHMSELMIDNKGEDEGSEQDCL